jgi:N,N'-diacetyllegionaminate synthase
MTIASRPTRRHAPRPRTRRHRTRPLKAHAEDRGLVFLSSPFDIASARLLADLGVCALKLGSGELTNHPFLADLATLGLPAAALDRHGDARRVRGRRVDHLRAHGGGTLRTLWFHCVSAYPAPASATNLRAMDSLRSALCAPVGMSDHSMGDAVAIAAAARGAAAIEKHLTLSRAMEGPDHAASLEPEQFAEMVRKIRLVESALGDGVKSPAACEIDTIRAARRSLVAAADLPAGHTIRAHDLVAKRPGDGICPTRVSRT